ncbi:MAG: hypothetical protein MCM46_16005 [Candidatus Manganitrophus sp. SB1]|nr:hypothetical protein [Candidatus Manganitrophus morganii]
MKRLFQFALLVILLGGIALAPALSQEQNKKGPQFPQKKTEKQEMGGMKDGGMMDDSMMSMMSNQNEMMAKMLDTMKEMAQMMKDQAEDPNAKAKADQMLAHIDQMKSQHQMMMGTMSGRGGSK